MALPIGLITAVAPLVTRLFDKDKVASKTNISTVAGGSLMGTAAFLVTQPDETSQIVGYILGAVGFLVSLYKENKEGK